MFFFSQNQKDSDYVFLPGPPRTGTTSLFSALSKHPNIRACKTKEPNFFNTHYDKDNMNKYYNLFPRRRPEDIYMDGSTLYMGNLKNADRIKRHMKNTKFIIMLRDPVERAFSHYKLQAMRTDVNISFDKLVENYVKNKKSCHTKYNHLISRSIYYPQIKTWLAVFDREDILIVKSEDFFARSEEIYKQVLNFLDLNPLFLDSFPIKNQSIYTDTISKETRGVLEDFFVPHNQELFNLVGRDFKWY